jgi:hypothetical protein
MELKRRLSIALTAVTATPVIALYKLQEAPRPPPDFSRIDSAISAVAHDGVIDATDVYVVAEAGRSTGNTDRYNANDRYAVARIFDAQDRLGLTVTPGARDFMRDGFDANEDDR